MENLSVKIKEFKNAHPGDLLGYNGKEWVPVSIDDLLKELIDEVKLKQEQITILKNELKETKETIKNELNSQRQAIAELLKGIVK